MTDFELKVLGDLSDIKSSLAETVQAQRDHTRRIKDLEKYNETQETRHWVKSLIVGAGIVVVHPIARKLGLDI